MGLAVGASVHARMASSFILPSSRQKAPHSAGSSFIREKASLSAFCCSSNCSLSNGGLLWHLLLRRLLLGLLRWGGRDQLPGYGGHLRNLRGLESCLLLHLPLHVRRPVPVTHGWLDGGLRWRGRRRILKLLKLLLCLQESRLRLYELRLHGDLGRLGIQHVRLRCLRYGLIALRR